MPLPCGLGGTYDEGCADIQTLKQWAFRLLKRGSPSLQIVYDPTPLGDDVGGNGPLSMAALRSLMESLNEEHWAMYDEWQQLNFALKTSSGEAYRELFIAKSRKSQNSVSGRWSRNRRRRRM